MANQNNTINYIEFPAIDLDRTREFYSDAFGWEFIDYGPAYTTFSGAGIDGGFNLETKPSSAAGVLVVLYQQELEKTQHKLRQLGSEVTKPIFAFPGGHRFHFVDPNGNELAVWSESVD